MPRLQLWRIFKYISALIIVGLLYTLLQLPTSDVPFTKNGVKLNSQERRLLMRHNNMFFSNSSEHLDHSDRLSSRLNKKGYTFWQAQDVMKKANLYDFTSVDIIYPNFTRRLPKFIDKEDEVLFWGSAIAIRDMKPVTSQQLRGRVEIVRNGTFKMYHDCGYKSDASYLRTRRNPTPGKTFKVLVPLVIPMGYLFQHFFDGTLPKLVQNYELIKRPEVKIILENPYHKTIHVLLDKLQISHEKIEWLKRGDRITVYKADYMIYPCVTPPLHPILWRRIRQLLGVMDTLTVPYDKAKVMILSRAGASSAGRHALNQHDILDYLRDRFGADKVLEFKGRLDVDDALATFSRVKIIIGTHGGAFYNMNYSPRNTTIIEFVPVLPGGADIDSLPNAIFWTMANMLGQPYWRIPLNSVNTKNDMIVPISKLERILDKVEPKTSFNN